MINVSNEFKKTLFDGNRDYLEYVDITLSTGKELNLTNKHLWNGGLSIEDSVSSDNSFDIGAAIVNKCTTVINNIYDEFSDYDFSNAKVVVRVGLQLKSGISESVRKGTYTVEETNYNGAIITLSCLDNMFKFDKPYSKSKLSYPASLGSIVLDACNICGVSLQTYNFPHYDYIIKERPSDEAITFREIISWCAQIAGCFCRCDAYGRLELKWYNQSVLEQGGIDGGRFDDALPYYSSGDNVDGGSFKPWNTGYEYDSGEFDRMSDAHHIYSIYSMDLGTDDVVITGIRISEKNKPEDSKEVVDIYQAGKDGYVLSIENNELIKNGAGKEIVGWLGEQLIGLRFRKADINHASDPTIEAGDIARVIDKKQNDYSIVISSTIFSTNSAQSTKSSARNPLRNSAQRFSSETKIYVDYRKDIEKEKTDREKALEELKNRVDNSPGTFTTIQTQSDGSKVYFLHNKPKLSESDIIWKMTAEAWAVSTDGGKTYNGGMTVDGDTIVRILTATGINADWIKSGAIRIVDSNKKETFYADTKTGIVRINASQLKIQGFSAASEDKVETLIEQNADSIRLKATKISWKSTFSSMTENGILTCRSAKVNGEITSEIGDSKITVAKGRLDIFNKNKDIGNIGSNSPGADSTKAGLVFDLEDTGDYMTWAAKDSSTDAAYWMKWTYTHQNLGGLTGGDLNAGCPINMHNYELKNVKWDEGGVTASMNFVQVLTMNSNGTVKTWGPNAMMRFKNGILVDLSHYQ